MEKMRLDIRHVSLGNIYLLVFGLYSYLSIISSSLLDMGSVGKMSIYATTIASMFLFIIDKFRNRITLRAFTLYSLMIILFILSAYLANRPRLLAIAMLIFCADTTKFIKVVRTSLVATSFALFTIICLLIFGVIKDYLYTTATFSAHCLGFSYYATFPYVAFFSIIMFLYLRDKKVSVLEMMVILTVNYVLYSLTTVRSTFYLTIFACVLDLLIVKYEVIGIGKKWLLRVVSCLFPIGAFIIYMVMRLYSDNSNWRELNTIFSNRLRLLRLGYMRYGIKPFGQAVEMNGSTVFERTSSSNYFYIDSGFGFSLLAYGLFFTLVLLFLYTLIYRYTVLCDKSLFIWVTCVFLFTVMNNVWISLHFNPLLLVAPAVFSAIRRGRGKYTMLL